MAFKTVAIAGATGRIGAPILKALLDTNCFSITILTRRDSTASDTPFPTTVKTALVSYASTSTLSHALRGQDVVISALTSSSPDAQHALLSAAVHAGVQRFIPSEFGSDTQNAHAASLPVFASKKDMESRLEGLAAQGHISYTYIFNGPFLDFGLAAGFLGLDLQQRKVTYLDAGEARFSTTTCATVARVVTGVLARPEQTRNRAVYVHDAALSLKDLLRLAKRALGDEGWTEVDGGTAAAGEKASYEKLARGEKDMGVFVGFLMAAIFREGYGGLFGEVDNEMFGIGQMGEGEIVEVIRKVGGVRAG